MANFIAKVPDDVLNDVRYLDEYYDKIFGGMTKEAAQVVLNNVKANMPVTLMKALNRSNLKLTRTYRTPSDDGINTKIVISGYFTNQDGRKTPAPLVANMFEYGSTKKQYPVHPFFRKSFDKAQIESTMKKAQKELSRGIIDE